MWLPKFTPDDKGKYHRELLKERGKAEKSLAAEKEHLANYKHSEFDKSMGYPENEGRNLVRNHITYYQGQIESIDNEIRLLQTPGLLCEGAVTHILLKWLGKKVDEFHHQKGHLGSCSGGTARKKIIVTTSPEHWDREADTMIETIQAGGWAVEVEPYEIEHWLNLKDRELRHYISIKIPVLKVNPREAEAGITDDGVELPLPAAQPEAAQPKKPQQLTLF